MRTSISLKINLIIFLVVLILGIVLGGLFIIDQHDMLHQEVDRRVRIIGELMARDFADALVRHDLTEMHRILEDAVLDSEINYVIATSPEGEILASRWVVRTQGAVHEHTLPLREPQTVGNGRMTAPFGQETAPTKGTVIGNLSIGVSLKQMEDKLSLMVARIATVVLLAIAASVVVGYSFVRIVLRRSLSPLLSGIQAMGAGNLFRRIEPDRHREIEEIGRAFNQMAERLSSSLISKGQLEAMVEERTAQLHIALHDRIRAQADLAEREERIRLLLDSTAEAIYGLDTDGMCTFCNPACLRLLAYERSEDLIGKNMHELIHHTRTNGTRYPAEECPIYDAFRNGKGSHVSDEVFWKADGTSINVEYWSFPVLKGEYVRGAVVTFLDITERIKLERQYVHAQKLEGIGVLAGGIAHDFNNLLMPILGYTEMAMRHLDEGHPAWQGLKTVQDSARRAAELTRQILAFSRKQVLQIKVLNLNDEIVAAGKMIGRLIGEDIDVRLDLAADLPSVKADPTQMQQVLMNLAVNARDAMPEGGRLTIETGIAKVDGTAFSAEREMQPGRYVLLVVSDTGSGMSEETRRHIFEPFFTTKEVGKGTGLGLSTVHGIVKQHGGDISVSSAPGRGTVFRIYLPCAEEALQEQAGTATSGPTRGSGTILLIEDDQTVRDFVAMVLADAGYTVTSVGGGAEALEASARSQFDLVVTDVIMPGMNGPELFRSIKALRPGSRVIYFSGYPAGSGALQDMFEDGEPFLQKPFTVEALLQKVHEVMPSPS